MMKGDNFLRNVNLFNRQRQLNRMFEEEGLTDEILNEQIELNKKKNELDIHDPHDIVYEEDGKEYVQ